MRKFLIDCGAYSSSTVEDFYENRFFRHRSDQDEYIIYCFEPNVGRPWSQQRPNVYLSRAAVWDREGSVRFCANDITDASSFSCFNGFNLEEVGRVPTIRLSRWVRHMMCNSDYIVLKLDIEGAEYDVLEDFRMTGTDSWLNELYVEFHELSGFNKSNLNDHYSKLAGLHYDPNWR